MRDIEDRLHAAPAGAIEAELVAIALEQTGAEHGALFLWDKDANGLVLVHHVVGGVIVTLPRVVRHDGPRAGIALHVYDTDQPILVPDTSREPLYAKADLTLDTSGHTVESSLAELQRTVVAP